ncbi:sigma factor-binding protein Crl [Klebsiella sp. BIGb0407]|uniref:sigma factor-binding protein Crl n=1 Tax=Klebsiella sp. BIGb0407 TaxID=2940603 RepID=UPI00216A6658|nr:sigma factor-binding protein Crl [Klebsiella sp. BIGb0407]MCS3432452.1 sigma factor-binding protein Crl [Klebsiella sp. BIGb0407]
MTLVNGHPRGRLLKKFTDLGPYIREEQCQDSRFFFDCLAVCVNAKPAPEKREFWGWWLELEAHNNQLNYNYHFGLFDKNGHWKVSPSGSQEVDEQVEKTLQAFFKRLKALLVTLDIELVPSEKLSEKAKALTV